MKHLFIAAALGCLAWSAQAVDPLLYPGIEEIAERIRSGDIEVGKTPTMAFGGRFHTIHAEAVGMSCTACHSTATYAPDHLFLRKAEFPRRGHPGAVPRANCIGCHQPGGTATAWYGTGSR